MILEAELRRTRALALTLVLPTLLATGCTATGDSGAKSDIVIAASLELTGALADTGKAYENALRLKVEQTNNGRAANARKVTLRIEDNRGEAATANSQISRFASDPSVSAIITGWCSECVVGAAKTINDKRVPTIALAPSTEVSTPVEDRRYIFKLAPNVNHDATELIAALTGAGVKTVRFMASADAYGRDAQDVMYREATTSPKIKEAAVEQLTATDANYTQAAKTVAQAKPDAVVVLAAPTAAEAAVRALRDAGYKGKLALDATAAGPLFLTGASTALEGASLVFTQTLAIDDVIATTPANASRKQWFRDYTARYGGYQASASFAADAVQLIVDAVDTTGSTEHDSIRAALETVRVDGLSGAIRLTPSDHSGLMPQSLTMLVARNGRWRLA